LRRGLLSGLLRGIALLLEYLPLKENGSSNMVEFIASLCVDILSVEFEGSKAEFITWIAGESPAESITDHSDGGSIAVRAILAQIDTEHAAEILRIVVCHTQKLSSLLQIILEVLVNRLHSLDEATLVVCLRSFRLLNIVYKQQELERVNYGALYQNILSRGYNKLLEALTVTELDALQHTGEDEVCLN